MRLLTLLSLFTDRNKRFPNRTSEFYLNPEKVALPRIGGYYKEYPHVGSMRSKRFRLVSEQRKTEERDSRFWPREK